MINFGKGYKNLRRYKQIADVLVKYGFNFFVEKLIEKKLVPLWIIKKPVVTVDLSPGKRLRLVFEELGPTFIKLGQILSTRADIISEDILQELSNLQDNAPEFPYYLVEDIFYSEFGMPIDDAFIEFDRKPIAAASIGQAHSARLHSGMEVVVKVQRPDIEGIIKRDINILCTISKIFDDYFKEQMPFKMKDIAEEFSNSIIRELDYTHEARNTEKFFENFQQVEQVKIPAVYWQYTSKKILTLERINGTKIIDLKNGINLEEELKAVADIIAKIFMKQVFIQGLFHGDPHPGNIFIMSDNRIAFIDFGITGYLDKNSMTVLADLFISGANKDVDKILDLMIEIDAVTEETDPRRFKEDISFLLEFYFNTPLKRLNMHDAISELMKAAYRNKVKLPSQFILLAKSILTLEGCVKMLNPDFSISGVAGSFVNEIIAYRLNPKTIFFESVKYVEDIFFTIRTLPKNLKAITKKIERNEIKLNLELKNLVNLEYELNKSSDKLSISIIISAAIIGSSLLMKTSVGPLVWGLSLIGLAGYIFAILSTLFLGAYYIKKNKSKK